MDERRHLEELLSALIDGELSPEERREALSRVDRDPGARELYERMQSMSRAMREEETPPLPEGLAEKIGSRVEETLGDVLRPARRWWLRPAALTGAASVAAALLIAALLHDHWDTLAPRIAYSEDAQQETAEAPAEKRLREELAEPERGPESEREPESERDRQRKPEPEREQTLARPDAPPADLEKKSAVPQSAPAPARVPDEKRAVAAAPVEGRPAQVEGAGSSEDEQALGAGEARLAQRKGKRADYEVRSGQLGRSDADAIAGDENVRTTPRSEAVTLSATAAPAASAPELNCTAIWISSTRIALREDAPADASERLSTLVESLQGRLVSEPESALMLPAPGLGEFVASLPVTGHAFVGPSPQIPRDRDCITFRFASIAIDSPEP